MTYSQTPTFWVEYLSDLSSIFPNLLENSTVGKGSRRRQSVSCPPLPSINHALNATGNIAAIDLFSAAWAILLGRYLKADQVCFGTTDSGAHTISRVLLDKQQSVLAVLSECQRSRDLCSSHQSQSMRKLLQTFGSGQKLFNTAVSYNGDNLARELYDLSFCVRESNVGFECYLDFSSATLSDSAAVLVASTCATILAELTSSLSTPLDKLSKLSPTDLARIMSRNEFPKPDANALFQDHFSRQVRDTPNAPALSAADAYFTYDQLDIASNVLANHLVGEGVGPEVVVPLCFEHSPWAIVAMIAVAKAGGAFTFLGPNYPRSRLADVVEQVGAKFILTSRVKASYVEGLLPTFVVSRDSIRQLPPDITPPKTAVKPSNLLYIIFTSGSTGKPKGVMIEHSNYLTSALPQRELCSLGPDTRVLQFASYTFDISLLETFTALMSGACVCVPDEKARSYGLAHIMNLYQTTWSVMTVSLSRVITPKAVPTLKTLLLGGEPLSKTDIDTWADRIQLINAYGPTEASVLSAVNPVVDANTDASNIGWQVGGLLWVLDSDDSNQLVPTGSIGELAIEGPLLARGYLGDREKTAAAFVENLHWMKDFAYDRKRRVYLTGDLVRRNIDGSILFVGRKDTQVKVRGFRIELGDVENNIAKDRLVNATAVFAPSSGACEKRLVGVLTLENEKGKKSKTTGDDIRVRGPSSKRICQAITEIQRNLAGRVQNYMVPSTWFVVESFPLTAHGKIDRNKVKKWIESMTVDSIGDYECVPIE